MAVSGEHRKIGRRPETLGFTGIGGFRNGVDSGRCKGRHSRVLQQTAAAMSASRPRDNVGFGR